MSQRLACITSPPNTVVGYRKDGRPIYNIAGGSVDTVVPPVAVDPSAPAPTADPVGEPKAAADTAGAEDVPTDAERALERMRAADRAKSAAEAALLETQKKLREFEDKDKTELERAKRDADEFKAQAEAAQTALKQARVNNAFLTHNAYSWHNPETALSLLNLSEVTISDDGKVTGLDKAIEALAKSDPYLLKEQDTKGSDLPPSGSKVGSGTKDKGGSADREKLLAKYPALRR